jgi:hypothetical protein
MRGSLSAVLLVVFVSIVTRATWAADGPGAKPATAAIRAAELQKRQRDADQYQVGLLVGEALACRFEGENARAADLFAQALVYDPDNAAAAAGRDEALRLPDPSDVPRRLPAELKARREEVLRQFAQAVSDAEDALVEGEPMSAARALTDARMAVCGEPAALNPAEVCRFNARLGYLHACMQECLAAQRAPAVPGPPDRRQPAQRKREEIVTDLIREARRLTDEGCYDAAVGLVDQILILDRRNDYAVGVRPLLEDRAGPVLQHKWRRKLAPAPQAPGGPQQPAPPAPARPPTTAPADVAADRR